MKKNTATEEAKTQVGKEPRSNAALWLTTSIILLLGSLISLIYLYLRGSKSRS